MKTKQIAPFHMIERPDIAKDHLLWYLDDLRESGEINFDDLVQCLRSDFRLSNQDSRTILLYWTDSFTYRWSGRRTPNL